MKTLANTYSYVRGLFLNKMLNTFCETWSFSLIFIILKFVIVKCIKKNNLKKRQILRENKCYGTKITTIVREALCEIISITVYNFHVKTHIIISLWYVYFSFSASIIDTTIRFIIQNKNTYIILKWNIVIKYKK